MNSPGAHANAAPDLGGSGPLPATPHRPVKWWSVTAVAAAMVLAMGVAQTSAGHTVLQKAGLLAQPSSYTSLAFQRPQSLPPQIDARQANVTVSFQIRNASPAAQVYQWSVLVSEGTASSRVAAGGVTIAAGHGATITRSASILCVPGGRVRITVSLAHPNEFIDSWLDCKIA